MANIEVTRVALSTGLPATTQDITISGFGTPTAAMFIVSGAPTNNILENDAFMSVGFTDGTRSRCIATFSDTGQATSTTSTTNRTTIIARPNAAGSAVDLEFDFDSWITDGVRISVVDQDLAGFLCTVILFKGTSNAYVNYEVLTTGASPIDVTNPGFEPDIVFALCNGAPEAYLGPQGLLNFGIGINDGSDTQRLLGWASNDAQASATVTSYLGNADITAQTWDNTVLWAGSIGSYDSSGFTLTPTTSNFDGDSMSYLALKFTNTPNMALFDVTYPSSGNYVETSPGFQPEFGFLAFSAGVTVRNTATQNSNIGAIDLTPFDATNIYSSSISDEHNSATMDTSSFVSDELRMIDNNGGLSLIRTSGYTMDSGGWTFTRNGGDAINTLGFGLAVAEVSGLTVDVGTSNETDTANSTTPQLGGQVDTGTATEADSAHGVLSGAPQAVSITRSDFATDSPVIRGTAAIEYSGITVNVSGDEYTTKSLSGVWRAPVNPWEQTETTSIKGGALSPAYVAEPIAEYTQDGNLLCVFRRGTSHADNTGELVRTISTDNGATWGAEALVYDSTYDTRNQAGGVDPATGRVVIFYRDYDAVGVTTEDMGYVYSDDHGVTWSSPISLWDQISDIGSTQYAFFGRMIRTVNGLMQVMYDVSGGAYAFFSKDDGLTWGDRTTIYTSASSEVEPSPIAIDTSRIVCIIRTSPNNSYKYVKSDDGGKTWGAVSTAYAYTASTQNFGAPAFGIRVENDLLLAWNARSVEFQMYTNRMNIEDFWITPQDAWSTTGATEFKQVTSTADTFTNTDYGYPWIAVREGHEYTALMFWYDLGDIAGDNNGIRTQTFPRLG